MLRSIHDEERASRSTQRADRIKRDVPLSDREDAKPDDDDYADIGEYVPTPGYDGLSVKLRAVSRERLSAFGLRSTVRMTQASESDPMAHLEDVLSKAAHWRHEKREFLRDTLARLEGLEDNSGPYALPAGDALTDAELDLIDGANLTNDLVLCAQRFQILTDAQKKTYGVVRPSTSPNSTAASAPAPCVAPEAALAVGAGMSGPSTSATPAPAV